MEMVCCVEIAWTESQAACLPSQPTCHFWCGNSAPYSCYLLGENDNGKSVLKKKDNGWIAMSIIKYTPLTIVLAVLT